MCAIVCPFDVITYHASPDAPDREVVATKCNSCIGRLRQGLEPACVESCKVGALVFGDINELTKAARTHYSAKVSVAASQVDAEIAGIPPVFDAWRQWGATVTRLNAAAPEGV
jgi:carbon-monoxide dehydrogenase iron sulfur subunit